MKNEYIQIRKRSLIIALSLCLAVLSFSGVCLALQEKPSSFHVYAWVTRADGTVTYLGHHSGSLTIVGKNFIEGKLGDKTFANNTAYAIYGSLSTSSSAFADTWKNIPTEIVADGLERAEMTYASTGNGAWTLTKQWTASGTHTDVQRVGINWANVANDSTLAWADTITPVTLNSGDKLTIVATTTASG